MEKNKIGIICSIVMSIIAIVLLLFFLNTNTKLTNLKNNLNEIKEENKKAITAELFKDFMATKSFDIETIENYYSKEVIKNAGVKQGYSTKNKEDIEYRVNFFSFKDENSAQYLFYNSIMTIRNEDNGNLVETTEKSMNHTKYTVLTNGTYKVVCRIGNTVIWATINEADKQHVNNLLSEIGY